MKNNIKHILSIIVILLTLLSCEKDEEALKIEEVKNLYTLPTGDEAFEKYQRDIYEKYSTYVLTDFEKKDYQWNLDQAYTFLRIEKQEDTTKLNMLPDLLNKVFFDLYSDDFLKAHSPYKIIIGTDIVDTDWWFLNVYGARNYMALGNFNKDNYTTDNIKRMAANFNSEFWGKHLHKYKRIAMPNQYYKISDIYYEKSPGVVDPSGNTKPQDVGFFCENDNYLYPTKDEDIGYMIREHINKTAEEIDGEIADYPKLKQKVEIFRKYVKDKYGVDITKLTIK